MDTKIININGAFKFNVYEKNTKLPSPWTPKTPKRNKRKTIDGDLHFPKRVLSNFDKEIFLLKDKFMKADYPLHFINSVVNKFQICEVCGDESFVIPPTIPDKIFGAKWSNSVKMDRKRKVWYVFLHYF